MSAPVRLVGVSKYYAGAGDVLRGVDAQVHPGRITVIAGANGSGKSTLLRIVAGCTRPTRGEVQGRPRVVGFLPARFPASPRFTVRSYLRHLAAIHGTAGVARSLQVLERLHFHGDLSDPMTELSTGNAQKVGLAQAVGSGARLVVLDEPWAALDADAADALDGLLTRRAAASAVVVADHTGRASTLPDVVGYRLEGGSLRRAGPAGPAGPEHLDGHVRIGVRGPAGARAVLSALPGVAGARTDGRTLTVLLDPRGADSWLYQALGAGCSVLEVHRHGRAPRPTPPP